MKRCLLAALLLTGLGPACRTAGPKGPPGPAALPEPLRAYVDQVRLLRHQGDARSVTVKAGGRLGGECDVGVYVRSVSFEKGSARFSLQTVGLPNVHGREPKCGKLQTGMQLLFEGLPANPDASELTARVDEVLQTPEAYLKSKGVRFDLAPGGIPAEVASQEAFASAGEKALGRRVTVWPKPLLVVNPWYHELSGRVRQEGQVELEAIVGTDGRLHRPSLKTGLSVAQEEAVLRAMTLWRFEPARRANAPIGARIVLSPILRVY